MKQTSLLNLRKAGRKAIHDPGIRHTHRPVFKKPASLHLTIKIAKEKSNLKNKEVLSILKRAILNSRKMGLRVIHFTLEYDHIHLLIEAENNHLLGKGMQSFGVTLSKAINKLKKTSGQVYRHRYHFRKITSARQLKNVMNYIFRNGLKHGTSAGIVTGYNSIQAEKKLRLFFKGKLEFDFDLIRLLDQCRIFYPALDYVT